METYFALFLMTFILVYVLWDAQLEEDQIQRCEKCKMKHAFYCTRCKRLYSAPNEVEACPYCTQKNQYLHF